MLTALKSQLRSLPPHQQQQVINNLHKLPEREQEQLLSLIEEVSRREARTVAQGGFLDFVRAMWPGFIMGRHHKIMAEKFEAVARGDIKRLAISLPPRHTKSQFASYLLPAWYLGKYPDRQIMEASHTADLAVDFGRKVRNLVSSEAYQQVFPGVTLQADSKSAGRWGTNKGGVYNALGVGGAAAGKGADLCCAPESLIHTKRGTIIADHVVVGDYVWGGTGWAEVFHIIESMHTATVVINNDIKLNDQHPMWVDNNRWVPASEIKTGQMLTKVSLLGNIRIITNQWRNHETFKLFTRVQHLGNDEATLHKPQGTELRQLWRSRDKCVRALEQVCRFLGRHGAGAVTDAYPGSTGQRERIHPRELPVGFRRGAAEQSQKWSIYHSVWPNIIPSSVGAQDGVVSGSSAAPDRSYEPDSRAGTDSQANELAAKGSGSTFFGWCRNKALPIIRRGKERISNWKCVERLSRGIQKRLWVQVAVRSTCRYEHEPRRFVNFHVGGDNTFVVNTCLSHNCVIDDPFSEQDVKAGNGAAVFATVWEWYMTGPRQRLQPGAGIIVVHTRWGKNDLIGRLLDYAAKNPEADQWQYIEFPAIMPSGSSLWPEFWPIEELLKIKATIAPQYWNAQFMQDPVGEEGALIKREWWQNWEKEEPPKDLDYIIMSLDAAQEAHTRADYNALTVWGLFQRENAEGEFVTNVILLDAWKERMEFPDLKREMFKAYKKWEPDTFIVEKKSNGAALYQEFRAAGVPVSEYTPGKGSDKVARVNAVSDMFSSGLIWAPKDRMWAMEVIDECASFPNGDHDDMLDSTTQAMIRIRKGGFIKLPSDEEDEDRPFRSSRHQGYY